MRRGRHDATGGPLIGARTMMRRRRTGGGASTRNGDGAGAVESRRRRVGGGVLHRGWGCPFIGRKRGSGGPGCLPGRH
jgi:hypothetical protein